MLLTLNYHRVARVDVGGDYWNLCVSPENFASHLELLADEFHIIDAGATPLHAAALSDPNDNVLVTFDDGYADNFYIALPLLQKYGIPAVVFLASGYVGMPNFWWDVLQALYCQQGAIDNRQTNPMLQAMWEYLRDMRPGQRHLVMQELLHGISWAHVAPTCRPLTKAEVAELATSPLISFGGHTRWHSYLPALSFEEALDEIIMGRCDIGFLTGRHPVGFAYPFGVENAAVQEAVAEAGFTVAFTSLGITDFPAENELINNPCNPLSYPRICIGNWPKYYLYKTLTELSSRSR
jgi:peptidoglycan/xylan/chitin deacetylase (PgdA/CDA1 family)